MADKPSDKTDGGDYVGRDVNVGGDEVGGDKVEGDKYPATDVNGPAAFGPGAKAEAHYHQTSLETIGRYISTIYRYLKRYYWLLCLIIIVELPVSVLFFQYRERFLINEWFYISIVVLLAVVVWMWIRVYHALSLKKQVVNLTVVASVLTLIWIILMGEQVWRKIYPAPLPLDKFGIAVATFGEGPDFRLTPRARQFSQLLLTDVRTTTNTIAEIESKKIGVVENLKVAEQDGNRVGAELVIWGQILENNKGIVVRVQLLVSPGFTDDSAFPRVLPTMRPESYSEIRSIDPNDLIVTEEAKQLSLGLSRFCLGLFYYLNELKPNLAAKQFEIALEFLLSDSEEANNGANLGIVYYYLGKSYQLQGRYADSFEMLERAEMLSPEDLAVALGQAYNHLAMGREVEAHEAFIRVIRLANKQPVDDTAAIYNRAFAYEALEDYENALDEYRAILRCDVSFYDCQSDFFIAYLSAARILLKADRAEQAKVLYEQAEQLAEGDPDKEFWINVDWGQFYEQSGETESALQAYAKAIALNPSLVTPYLYRSELYKKLNITDAAFLDYRKVIELNPDPSRAHTIFAKFLYHIGHYPQAIVHYKRALQYPTYDSALLHAYLGQTYTQLERKETALDKFSEALQNPSPNESYIRSIYGLALWQFGCIVEAISQMEESLKINPKLDVQTSLNLAQLYEDIGELGKAEALYMSLLAANEQVSDDEFQIVNGRLQTLRNGVNPNPGIDVSEVPRCE